MKKIKLYIVSSNDSFISPLDNDIEWLINYPIASKKDHELFLQSVDSVILGGNTYRELCCMDILWPYKNKEVYVVTKYPSTERTQISFISENVIEALSSLKQNKGKDIWLAGGATLASSLLDTGLIDELIITYIPMNLQKGIPLFSEELKDTNWVLKEDVCYENGASKKTYVFRK